MKCNDRRQRVTFRQNGRRTDMKTSNGFFTMLLFRKVYEGTTFGGQKLHTADDPDPVREAET